MPDSPLLAEQTTFRGWQACHLANDFVRLVAVPDIGGRIMAYDLGAASICLCRPRSGRQALQRRRKPGRRLVGGVEKLRRRQDLAGAARAGRPTISGTGRPIPCWIPAATISPSCTAMRRQATIQMVSPPIRAPAFRSAGASRLAAPSSRVRVDLAFRNVADRPVRWSIWDVMQLTHARMRADGSRTHDPSCVVTVPLNAHSVFQPKGYAVLFGADDNPQWQVDGTLFRASYLWQIGKVAIDSPAGWIAFSQGSRRHGVCRTLRLCARRRPTRMAAPPWSAGRSAQARSPTWTTPKSGIYLMETEVLSPLCTIAPGHETTFTLEWGSCRCAGAVVDVQRRRMRRATSVGTPCQNRCPLGGQLRRL